MCTLVMAEALHNVNGEDKVFLQARTVYSDECEKVELVEELVQDDIGSNHEMILVPGSRTKTFNAATSSSMQTSEAQTADAQKQYYCETFLLCVQTLKQEELIKRSIWRVLNEYVFTSPNSLTTKYSVLFLRITWAE